MKQLRPKHYRNLRPEPAMTNAPTIHVLDHGFVRLVNLAGPQRRPDCRFDADDTDPARSARRSFNAQDKPRPREDDLRLAKYLIKHKHTTPLEMIEVWLEMQLPIFVARQFVRHRTTSINEVSARYVQLPSAWYIPDPEHVGGKAKTNKQGRGDAIAPWKATVYRKSLDLVCWVSYKAYQTAIKQGVAPEVARNFLHVNHYTAWLWKQNLHNLMHFLLLRLDEHAQYESQVYASAILQLIEPQLPNLVSAYREFGGLK